MIFGRNPNRGKNRPQGLQNRRPGNLQDGNQPDRRPQAIIEAGLVRRAVRFSHLPGIFPRIRELSKKFGHFAYMLALIYRAVNLLPVGHAYLNPMNIGKFGVRDVIATAANGIVLKRENADKIAIFVAVLLSVVMIAVQMLAIGFFAVVGEARAGSFFAIPAGNETRDVVYIFLDQVFGVAGVFGSGAQALGTPVHAGLHAMLAFYSMAMMVLAVFIVVYYIITVVGEAAVSGTPFGRRFNSVWAPIRLVVALGLLVPIAGGLNSAQFITLYTAKLGSNLATNSWGMFVDQMRAAGAGNVFVRPHAPEMVSLIQNAFMSQTCAMAYNKITGSRGTPSNVFQAYLYVGTTATAMPQSDAGAILTRARQANVSSIKVVWTADSTDPDDKKCGEINLNISPVTLSEANAAVGASINSIDVLQTAYIQAILTAYDRVQGPASRATGIIETNHGGPRTFDAAAEMTSMVSELNQAYTQVMSGVETAVRNAISQIETTTFDQVFENMKEKGWGASGMWYARIGSINSRFGSAVRDGPTFRSTLAANTAEVGGLNGWANWLSFGLIALNDMNNAIDLSRDVTTRFTHTIAGVTSMANSNQNFLEQFLKWLFGIDLLIDFRTEGAANMDPMVSMMSIGEGMLEKAVYAVVLTVGAKMGAVGAAILGGAVGTMGATPVGGAVAAVGGFAIGTVLSGLLDVAAFIFYLAIITGFGAGVVLFYLLPLMPFIYFFFAVVGWIMEIFEAIVAMPLWAMAHLKIDGDGLAGPLATNGYFLLLGIFLRPVMIVFGLIGGYIIFGAAAYYLFSTFDVVVNVIRGGEQIGYLGELVYTLIFVYMSYNLAIMCFKMVDTVPNAILRWIGQGGASPFSDNRPDPIQGNVGMLLAANGLINQLPKPSQFGGSKQNQKEAGEKLGEKLKNRKGPAKLG